MKQTLNCVPRTFKRRKLSKFVIVDWATYVNGKLKWHQKRIKGII